DVPRLGLPPGVDDGAPTASDDLPVPDPGFGVDGLTDGAEQPERREIAALGILLAPADEGSDRGRGRVENRDAVLLDDSPEAVLLREIGRALVHDDGRTVRQGAVVDVGVAGYPADIGGAPERVALAEIEDVLGRRADARHVTAGRVHDPLRLPRGSRRVQQIQ